jgi:glycosyltransferase involved in cell wall biosynthesis
MMDLSVVIPVYNEDESITELASWIEKVCNAAGLSFEILFIDDGSSDSSWNRIEQLTKNNSSIKGVRFRRNYGKAAALHTGFQEAAGDVIITMDSDLQDSPDEIPELYRMIRNEGYDMVSGWKKKRYDPFIKRCSSKFYNSTARISSGIKLHDFNCGLKAYRNDVIKSIEGFGEMHRYIPMLAKRQASEKSERKWLSTDHGSTEYQNMEWTGL